MFNVDNIIVPTDFSDYSDVAFKRRSILPKRVMRKYILSMWSLTHPISLSWIDSM